MTLFRAIPRIGAILTFVVLLNAAVALGQQVTGTILGRVTDSAGAVVPGATIQVQNVDTAFSRTDQSDSEGRYLMSNLPLGSYSVTVQKEGFQTMVRQGIVLSVGSQVTVNGELVVGAIQQQVEVEAEAPQIETTNSTLSQLVTPEQVRNLPLNGRSVDSLALLAPGVFANRSTGGNATVGLGLHVSVTGTREEWNLYLLDGTVTNDSLSGRSSAAGEALGVEGILEFRLLTHNFAAEYGRTAGGVFSAVTRSGSNSLHGSAYEFVRNNIFDARNFFNVGPLPAFRRNQFGGAVGGPIIRDHLFFFANYEGLRQRQGVTEIASVPNANARQGLVPNPTTGVLQQVTVNSAVVPYLNLYPLPNGTDHGDGTANFTYNYSQPTTEDYTMVRMDYLPSSKDTIFARYVYDPSKTALPTVIPPFVTGITGNDRLFALGETHVFSTSSLNDFRFALNRTLPTQMGGSTSHIDPSLSFVPGAPLGSISSTTSGLSGLGSSTIQFFEQNLITGNDTFTKVWGAHSLKFGGNVERQQTNSILCLTGCQGQFTFTGLTTLLAGTPSSYQQQVSGPTPYNFLSPAGPGYSDVERGWRRTLFALFAQDDIRLRRNLTINLGLRWEAYTSPSEVKGQTVYLASITSPTNTLGPPFISPKLNFMPRVGLAWDPTGSGKTSIRVGVGVYDQELEGWGWISNSQQNATFQAKYQISNPPFPNGLANVTASQFGTGVALIGNRQVQHNPKESTVDEWNLEVQRQLAPTLSLRVGYVGSHGYDLPTEIEGNTRVPTITANVVGGISFATSSPFTNPAFGTILTTTFHGISNYNGLEAEFRKATSLGLTLSASYTYSHADSDSDQITNGYNNSIPATVMDPYDQGLDYGLSAYDQRHTLVFNGTYQMPWDKRLNTKVAKGFLGGWAVNWIYSYGSGLPFDITTGFNRSNDGDSNNGSSTPDRPNLTSGFSSNPINGVTAGCTGIPMGQPLHTPSRWFDPCAFTLNPAGTFGNLGRDTVGGPGLSDVDFSLKKMTPLKGERINLEFRVESFNLFNHANFGLPNSNVFSSSGAYAGNAGQITKTIVDNRELQFGLKLLF